MLVDHLCVPNFMNCPRLQQFVILYWITYCLLPTKVKVQYGLKRRLSRSELWNCKTLTSWWQIPWESSESIFISLTNRSKIDSFKQSFIKQQLKIIMNIMKQRTSSVGSSRVAVVSALFLTVGVAILAAQVGAINLEQDETDQDAEMPAAALVVIENPENVAQVLENLLRNIVNSPNVIDNQAFRNMAKKRGLDLGISRGFSGSRAGKHLMGLSAARFANGPGR